MWCHAWSVQWSLGEESCDPHPPLLPDHLCVSVQKDMGDCHTRVPSKTVSMAKRLPRTTLQPDWAAGLVTGPSGEVVNVLSGIPQGLVVHLALQLTRKA